MIYINANHYIVKSLTRAELMYVAFAINKPWENHSDPVLPSPGTPLPAPGQYIPPYFIY